MEQLLRVGVITTTHGIRGEVKVFPTTDDIHRFDDLEEVILQNKKEQLTLHIEHVKYFKNIVIEKFKEYNNINDSRNVPQMRSSRDERACGTIGRRRIFYLRRDWGKGH